MSTVAAKPEQVNPLKDSKPTQELVRHQSGTVLASPTEYAAYVAQARSKGAHVLSPVTDIGSLPANWVFVPSAVYLNPDEAAGDVYKDGLFCRGDEVAPTKVGLRKIAKAAGISWKVTRQDSNTVPNYWEMKCEISYRGHDGLIKTEEASYPWDLRDGSPRVAGMSAKELNRARLNGHRRCEAGAINAAIREYGIKQKYSKAELARPFVVFNLVFQPETEEQKNMLAQAALTGTTMLYGGTATLPPSSSGEVVDQFTGEIKDDEPAKIQDFTDEPDPDAPKPVKVTHVGVSEDKQDYYVTIDGGARLHTKDRAVAMACREAMRAGTPLVIEAEGLELLEIGGGGKY